MVAGQMSTLVWYSRGTQFEYSLTEFVRGFPESLQEDAYITPCISRDLFPSSYFQFHSPLH